MSMIHRCALAASTLLLLLFGACGGQNDYQGGGRRTDLGRTDAGIAIGSGGDANSAGSAGTGGGNSAGAAGRAGYAGCPATSDAGQGAFTDCTP